MKPKRTKFIGLRLTENEMNLLSVPIDIQGRPERALSRLVRARLFTPRRQNGHPADCKHCRLLASAVNNLNVIARRALDLASPETALAVIAHLAAVEREIRRAFDTTATR